MTVAQRGTQFHDEDAAKVNVASDISTEGILMIIEIAKFKIIIQSLLIMCCTYRNKEIKHQRVQVLC